MRSLAFAIFGSCIIFLCSESYSQNKNFNTAIQSVNIDSLIENAESYKNTYPDSTIYLFQKTIDLIDTTTNKFAYGKILSRIGGAYYIKGDYINSLSYFLSGLNIWKSIESKAGIIKGLNNVALIQHMLEDDSAAIANHKIAIRLCKETNDSSMLAINYFNLSLINNDQGNYDSALYYAQKSFDISRNLKKVDEIYKNTTLLGHIYLNSNNLHLAKENFLIVINNDNYKNNWDKCYALAGLSKTEQLLGRYQNSIEYGLRALSIAREIDALWDIQYISGILSKSYELIGDYFNAYNYHNIFKTYSDSIFNEENDRKISNLQLEQKNIEYKLLQRENEIYAEKVRKQNIQIFMIILALTVAIAFVGILYRINYVKSKLNKKLKEKNNEINDKNSQLTKLNSTKDTLFRVIGHDLKSPMSTVVSFTDMILNNYDDFSEEEIKEYIMLSKSASNDAILLLQNLLEWAKSQTEFKAAKKETVNIYELVNKIIGGIRTNLISKNINLRMDISADLTYSIDINMTSAILRNFLINAIKFSYDNGEINIRGGIIKNKLQISVEDFGVGMDNEKIETLFDGKNAKSTPGTNNEQGVGIGLLLCKDFAAKQGGSIWAESEPGKGSTFYLKL